MKATNKVLDWRYCHWILFFLFFQILSGTVTAQVPEKKLVPETMVPDGTEGEFQPSKDSVATAGKKKKKNQLDLGFTTMSFGLGFLYEYAGYGQDKNAKIQADSADVALDPAFKVRDFRLLIGGQINTKREITWKLGIMYDGTSDKWFLRESGVMVAVPELWGRFFIGRTKEGFSLNKVMNGYSGWTLERQMAIDVIPILADGIKWLGYLPKSRIGWNLGIYTDWASKGQSFSTYSWQYAARLTWLAINAPETKSLMHIGLNFRRGDPVDGHIRVRSRPEANPAPYFIDTGTFPSARSNHYGIEAYYTRGPLMIGSEYYFHHFISGTAGDHTFNGGDLAISYILTGESRPYTTVSGIYGFVPIRKSLFDGGWGAIEAVLRLSHLDLDDADIKGGKFWRLTPMLNWYISTNFRLELAYGYGKLDRYGLVGTTQFFQSRIQFTIL